jgi:aspartate/methionine/tyrosine aminotransferase
MTPKTLARPLAKRAQALPEVAADASASDQPAPEAVARAAFDALDAGRTHYTDRPGILPLRERAVALLSARYGLELNAAAVTITCGVIEGRYVTIKQLAQPGQHILCVSSSPELDAAAALCGVALTTDPAAGEIALLYLRGDDDRERTGALLAWVVEHTHVWIVWETAGERGLHPANNPMFSERTITLHEMQGLEGWRVGWMAGSKAANQLRAYKQSMTICTTSISQWAALGAEA